MGIRLMYINCFGANKLSCIVSSKRGAVGYMAVINKVKEAGNKTNYSSIILKTLKKKINKQKFERKMHGGLQESITTQLLFLFPHHLLRF